MDEPRAAIGERRRVPSEPASAVSGRADSANTFDDKFLITIASGGYAAQDILVRLLFSPDYP